MTLKTGTDSMSWYREPMVWLLVAILAVAFAAGITILSYALLHPDVEVHSERRPAPTVTGTLVHCCEAPRPA